MHPAHTPLYATACIGPTISRVKVFPTHITYQQSLGPDISVPSHTIASVEERVYEHGFVILRTTSRRRIICTVHPKRAAALCAAIRMSIAKKYV
jgi:hypothetical protein